MKYLVAILFSFSLLIISCSTSGNSVSQSLVFNIIVGEGGGFTGLQEGKFIDSTGKVFSFSGRSFETADKRETSIISPESFQDINNLTVQLDSLKFNMSGNLYKYIILKKSGSEDKRLSWTDGSEHPSILDDFYNKINELTKNIK